MQRVQRIAALSCLLTSAGRADADADAEAAGANPVEKTVQLLTQLQSQLVQDGQNDEKAYQKFFHWCDDSVQQKMFEIKSASREQAKLEAAISEANSEIDNCNTAIEELSSDVSTNEKKLQRATAVRGHEAEDFNASEKELMETIDMLDRAIGVLEKESKKGGSLLQSSKSTQSLEDILVGLTAVVDGASFAGDEDKQKLAAFIEEREDAEDAAEDGGELTVATTKGSSSIIETMEDLRDKAESQLRKEREEEAKAKHNFDLLELALKAAIEDGNKDLEKEKASLAASNEAKATAEGNLAVTKNLLAEATHLHEEIQNDCMQKAGDHEVTTKGRAEELAMVTKVKKIVQSSMAGFVQQPTSSSVSFLQVASKARAGSGTKALTSLQATGGEVARLVSKLASEQRSRALSKLASKISAALRYTGQSASDDGPFDKVKGLVQDMIAKLEKEASSEGTEKAYCDEQLKVTGEKQAELEDITEGLKAGIDEAASQSATQKGQVKDLQQELAELAKLTQEMDEARAEAKASYDNAAADINKGLEGVGSAIKLLREYYASDEEDGGAAMVQTSSTSNSEDGSSDSSGSSDSPDSSDASFDAFMQMKQPAPPEQHEKSTGAGGGIVAMLQVIESDLTKSLAEQDTEESSAVAAYEEESHENAKVKATKEQDVALKTREFKALDKTISDQSGDLDTSSSELDSILDYMTKLKERCIAKADPYEERKKRRDAEINGLTEAMNLLGGEGAFLQRRRQ